MYRLRGDTMDIIRKALLNDLPYLIELFFQLEGVTKNENNGKAEETFKRILKNENQHILVAECENVVCASVTVTVIESLTHGNRPYAVVEHVITHKDYRGRGYAFELLNRARDIAIQADCYKIMLITGRSEETVHNLYKRAGYKNDGKTAYTMYLDL